MFINTLKPFKRASAKKVSKNSYFLHWNVKKISLALALLLALLPLLVIGSKLSTIERIAKGLGEIDELMYQTNQTFSQISQQSKVTAITQKQVNFSQLPDLTQQGQFSWRKKALLLNEPNHTNSKFITQVYLPNVKHSAPVIVISPGFAADPDNLTYLAQRLASYGFAVALPRYATNQPNTKSLFDYLTNGVVIDEKSQPQEYINRTLKIKIVLDELQKRSQSDPTFKINAQQVGVIGLSFGGSTALTLAGATINFNQLKQDCKDVKSDSVSSTLPNLSLLLQCRALELPQKQYDLSDKRIKAVMLINPVSGSLFGKEGLKNVRVPVMFISSSDDIFTPALKEQIKPFQWLNNQKKYFVAIQNTTHFSIPGNKQAKNPSILLSRRYTKALSTAFFQTYVAEAKEYKKFLSSAYANSISQEALQISLVHKLRINQIETNKKTFSNNHNLIPIFSKMQPKFQWLFAVYKHFYDYRNG